MKRSIRLLMLRNAARAIPGSKSAIAAPKISAEALREVEAALNLYLDEVIAADLTDHSKDVYTYHSRNFVRWLTGEFTPGSRHLGEER